MTKVAMSIFSELDLILFQSLPNNHFKILNPLPDWGQQFFSVASTDEEVELLETFPFLESFMPEAIQCWKGLRQQHTTSGVWTEVDQDQQEYQLEAQAVSSGDLSLLVISNVSRTFKDRHHVYQKAREIALANEKLKVKLNHRQRLLQSQIEKKLFQKSNDEGLSKLQESVCQNATAVLICKPDGGVEVINQALVDIYRVNPEKSFNQRSLLRKWLREAETLYPEIHRVLHSGSYWEGDFESEDDIGKKKWIRLTIGPVLDDEGQIAHYICIANDISDLHKSSQEVEKLTEYDLTTNLPNRRYFWRQLTLTLDECASKNKSLALIYIDLDHFKRINEGLGHHAGDFLLSTIAARLSRSIKRGDFIAHLGGDEFALIINLAHNSIDLGKISDRLMSVLNKPISIEDNNVTISASIGIAVYPQDGRDATTLMKHSDLAMYQAKELGRNQYQIFSPQMERHFVGRIRLETQLREAITKRQFVLLYQPQICTGNEPYLRMEALIRWEHPEEGLISPAKFIPIAEENGLIIEIGEWVLRTACQQAKQFLDDDYNVTMSVNVSARQIKDMAFCDLVEQVLKETQLPPSHLELEITETTVMQDMETVHSILNVIRKSGVTIALDDFGSGFSSLNYLKNLPVDNLKLDRTFIHELPHSEEGKAITSSLIKLAHDLNMKVIAEGVENRAQLDFLSSQGCDYIQGYFFYCPLEAAKIKEIFQQLCNRSNERA